MPVTKRQKLHGSMVVMRRGLGNKPLVEELSDGCVAVNTSESDDDWLVRGVDPAGAPAPAGAGEEGGSCSWCRSSVFFFFFFFSFFSARCQENSVESWKCCLQQQIFFFISFE
jgi:hypothetical protein